MLWLQLQATRTLVAMVPGSRSLALTCPGRRGLDFRIQFSNSILSPSSPDLIGRSSTRRLVDSIAAASGILDRPLSRAMTIECDSAFSRRDTPESCRNVGPPEFRERREDRVRAAPAVSRASPRGKKTHTSIQVQRKHSGLPCAVVLTLLRALPGERLSCHRRPRENRFPLRA